MIITKVSKNKHKNKLIAQKTTKLIKKENKQ